MKGLECCQGVCFFSWKQLGNNCRLCIRQLGLYVTGSTEQDGLEQEETKAEKLDCEFL